MVLSGGAKVATAEQISQTTGDAEDDQFMDKVKSVQASSKTIDDDENGNLDFRAARIFFDEFPNRSQ